MSFPGYCRKFFRIFSRNVLARCSKLHFKCPEEHDSWKKLLFENVDFFSNSDLEQILYESFVATLRQLRDHYNPSVHRNILNKYCSLFDLYQFFSFMDIDRCNFEHSKKTICQFCQYGIQRIQRIDWMKFLSYKELELFYHFWTLNEKSLEFLPENFVTVV